MELYPTRQSDSTPLERLIGKTLRRFGAKPNVDVVEDVLGEVWLVAKQRGAQIFDQNQAVTREGCCIVQHACGNVLRRTKRRWVSLADEAETIPVDGDRPLATCIRSELIEHVRETLEGLEPDERDLLKEHYFDGVSLREVANRHGRTFGAVNMSAHSARKRFRNRFARWM